jgi:hypothetical protein
MKILNEKELAKEAARLLKAGRMPSPEELGRVMVEIRREYANKIRRARREGRKGVVVQ